MNYSWINEDALEAAITAVAGEGAAEAVADLYEAIDAVERQAISEGFEAGLEAAGVGTTTPQVEGFSYSEFFDDDDSGFLVTDECQCDACRWQREVQDREAA